jgi:S-ribosylhomocysteine lyase LuxS involved in autoinducer biosynthesis
MQVVNVLQYDAQESIPSFKYNKCGTYPTHVE